MVALMERWPQLTPKDIRDLTPAQAENLLKGPNPTFKNRTEYEKWARQRKR